MGMLKDFLNNGIMQFGAEGFDDLIVSGRMDAVG